MSVIVECDHAGCAEAFEAGVDGGDWTRAPDNVSALATEGTGYSGFVYLYLPDGWSVKVDEGNWIEVMHCPRHANEPA